MPDGGWTFQKVDGDPFADPARKPASVPGWTFQKVEGDPFADEQPATAQPPATSPPATPAQAKPQPATTPEQQQATADKYAGWDTVGGPADSTGQAKPQGAFETMRQALAPAPNTIYGSPIDQRLPMGGNPLGAMLSPFARDATTGETRLTLPPLVRSLGTGVLDIMQGRVMADPADPVFSIRPTPDTTTVEGLGATPLRFGGAPRLTMDMPGGGPRVEPRLDDPPGGPGGPKGAAAELDAEAEAFRKEHGWDPRTETAPKQLVAPTSPEPAPAGEASGTPVPTSEPSTAQTRTKVTFFDQSRGDYATGTLVGTRPDGIHVVDQGAGAYSFVHPGSVISTREATVADQPATASSAGPASAQEAAETPTATQTQPKPPAPKVRTTSQIQREDGVGDNEATRRREGEKQAAQQATEAPAIRPVSQIQAEDGVPLGTAVRTHEAEKLIAEQAVTTTETPKPDEPDTENAHGGPWEAIGKNEDGETVYQNPDKTKATFDQGVPWLGAAGGADDDNKRLEVVEKAGDTKPQTAARTAKATEQQPPEEVAQGETFGPGDLWRMPSEQLEAMHQEAQTSERQKHVKAFGSEETAKEFIRLDRKRNSSDPDRADEGAREFDARFGTLTAEQERLAYGIGETGPQADDIKEVLAAHRNRTDNPEYAGYEAALAIRKVPAAEILAVPGGRASARAQGAYVALQNAFEDMTEAGVAPQSIAKTIAEALVNTGGWKPGDAAEIVGSFVEEMRAGSPRTKGRDDASPPARALPPPAPTAAEPDVPPPAIRPVLQIQAEDGVGLGTAVATHEAEKEAATEAEKARKPKPAKPSSERRPALAQVQDARAVRTKKGAAPVNPQTVGEPQADPDTAYHYTSGNYGMASNGSFTRQRSRWITFTPEEAQRISAIGRPYGATRDGLFVGAASRKRLQPAVQAEAATPEPDEAATAQPDAESAATLKSGTKALQPHAPPEAPAATASEPAAEVRMPANADVTPVAPGTRPFTSDDIGTQVRPAAGSGLDPVKNAGTISHVLSLPRGTLISINHGLHVLGADFERVPPPTDTAPPAPKSQRNESGHYAAGWSAKQKGEPRVLPSYFTKPSKNSRDWLRGWDAATVLADTDTTPPTPKPDLNPAGEPPTSGVQEASDERGDGPDSGGLDQPGSGEAGASGDRARKPARGRPAEVLASPPAEDAAPVDGGRAGGQDGDGAEPQAVSGNDAIHWDGDAADGRARAGGEGLAPDGAGERGPAPAAIRPNFHIDDPERLIGGTPKLRFARNRAALEALEAVEQDQRPPTQAELEAMAGYIGWGSFGQDLFQGNFERQYPRPGWDAEGKWLREHLGKEAWESAQRSIINAHYTDPPTVQTMWQMVQHMGFKGGRILEPSMGIGNFFGLMPRDVMAHSRLTGIELDRVTGQMATLLYPEAGVHIKGYQDSKTPDNFYDLVIGNWPFAAGSPPDRRYDKLSPTLHDYFFLKALDQTRPGGLVVGITSSGTMDKAGTAARIEMAKKGELIAAFRLPSGAFEKYAGTSVVTDIIVLRKREEPVKSVLDEPWIHATEMDTPAGQKIRVNQYFQRHPDAVLGQLDFGHGTTQGRAGMIVHRPADLMQRLQSLPARLPEDGYHPTIRGKEPRFLINNTPDRQGSVTIGEDGKLYQVQGERLALLEDVHKGMKAGTAKIVKAREDQLRRLVGLRKAYGALIDAERDGRPETEALRKDLAGQYEAFRDQHGPVKQSDGLRVLNNLKDPSFPALAALERPDGTPSRILSEPTIRSKRRLDKPSIADAYVLARNEQANFDIDRVAELAGKTRDAVEQHLIGTGAVLRTPGGGFEPADVYLSGNVRRKLLEAKEALGAGETMQPSIDALNKVLPPVVPYYQIEAKFGAPWVGDAAYKAFIGDLLGLKGADRDAINIRFAGSRWKVTFTDRGINAKPEATTVWGHPRYPFNKLVMAAMGNNVVKIMDPKDSEGGPYFNPVASEEVNAKIQGLREKFSDWAWQDPERKIAFETAYNETMNAIAKPHYDGSFMDMSGMALRRGEDPFALRRHQVNAIWRGVVQGRGLFAHEVGTGKAQPLDAKVLTPDGWKRMGEIKPGDVVIAGDGSPTLVEAVFPQGDKPIFRVTFSDGSTTECCDEHLWLTQTYRERNQAINGRRAGKVWPCAQAKIRPLSEIRGTLVSPHLGAKNHSIPIVGTVQFNASPLLLDPYVMGVLIGDGGMTGRAITFSTADQEIIEAMRQLLPQDCEVLHRSAYDYGIRWNGAIQYAVGGFGMVRSHPVIKVLADTGLMGSGSHQKFIPESYLFTSVEARVSLLQGLMDTDGTADARGCGVSFCTTSPRLADDVTTLVQSLGGVVSRTLKRPTFKRAGIAAFGRDAYTLNVSLPAPIQPFRLARKAALVKAKTKYPPRRFITAVDAVGTKPAQCIRVAHSSHLYVTDDFIVTHNTYTMGGIAVEGRRYGVFRKPLVFAHNANSASVAHEMQEMYPGGKFLYIDNLAPGIIATTLHRIANEDWDAVIMPHSLIDRISLTRETLHDLAAEQIAELENEAIEAAKEDGIGLTPDMMDDPEAMKKVRSVTAKQLVKQRQAILDNIEKQANRSAKENAVSFESLGVDAVIVDEAHEFKKPPIATRMQLRGLNTQTSNRSIALNFLTQYVKRQNNGRGVYLFTGTPVTNSLNEIFNMSRYFMDDRLGQSGIKDWDTWFNTFADAITDVELTAAGTYEPVKRLAAFVNVDELVRVMSEYTDVVQAKDMPEFVARATPSGKTLASPGLTPREADALANGRTEKPEGRPYKKVVTDVGEMSPDQKAILATLRAHSEFFKKASPKERREMQLAGDERVPIRVETNAGNASLDARLYDPDAADFADSKTNRVVRNVLKHYAEPKAAQVIFVDRGYNAVSSSEGRGERFVLVQDMIDKLVAGGIPRKEIAVVAGGIEAEKKKEIADAMNAGTIRVAIGQSGTLGVGVNMQVNLRAMHHMDAPWRPGDLEQRNGRGERQGNRWNTVLEYRYVTEGIDGRRWQVLTSKDRFIKQFINAFNDETGKRIGNIEGDAADIADSEDIMQTLSAAAGDPRVMLRAKYKADVQRMERRERMHTIGQAEAITRARSLRAAAESHAQSAARYEGLAKTWLASVERMETAAREAKDTHRWYEAEMDGKALHLGADIQAALDAKILKLARGEESELATVGGFRIIADWTSRYASEPKYSVADADGEDIASISAPTIRAIATVLNRLRGWGEESRRLAAEAVASIPAMEAAGKQDFPQQEKLTRLRQQFARLEEDLQANPIPPPPWLRHGAPIDSEIFVDGQPRTVRGHRMDDDYRLVTDEGEVAYLDAKDANGQPIYEVHPPPEQPKAKDEPAADGDADDIPTGGLAESSARRVPLYSAVQRAADGLKQAKGTRKRGQAGPLGPAAAPVEPRPASAPQVSRWPDGGGPAFHDLLSTAPLSGHDAAAAWVLERGIAAGNEHIAVVENKTGAIVHAGSNDLEADVDFAQENTSSDRNAYTLHHNHPGNTALSEADIMMLANPGISHVVAHLHDGNVVSASIRTGLVSRANRTAANIRANRTALYKAYRDAKKQAAQLLVDVIDQGKILADEMAEALLADVTNRLLHGRGIIDYISSVQLPGPVRAALRSTMRGLDNELVNRATESVLPAEQIGRLPQARRDPSGPGRSGPEARGGGRSGDVGGKGPKGSRGLSEEADDPLAFAKPPDPPSGHLKNALFDDQWGLSAERYEDWRNHPDTIARRAEVDRQRELWSAVDYHRNGSEYIRKQYGESGLSRERKAKLDRMLARSEAKLGIAMAAAKVGGVDPNGPFPPSPTKPVNEALRS